MYKETLLEDVLPMLSDLTCIRTEGKHLVYLCPFCGDSSSKSGHFYINTETGLWCCFLCGDSGNPLTLYAKYNNITNSQAYKKIHFGDNLSKQKIRRHFRRKLRKKEPLELIPEAPIEHRDSVYRDFLYMLPLYARHARDLQRRGFTKEQVLKNQYKSLPDDPSKRAQIVSVLASRYDLTGVRGFRKVGDKWECYYLSGYVIPFRDAHGRIQALQIRRDGKKPNPKYVFFGFRDSGIDNSTPVHIVNPEIARRTKSAWVTEGPLKGDYASDCIGACFVATPGASSWRTVVPILDELNIKEIIQAFDRDQDEKPAVAKWVKNFEMAVSEKVKLKRAFWPKEMGNGIDDALYNITRKHSIEINKKSPTSLIIREIKETEIVLQKAKKIM